MLKTITIQSLMLLFVFGVIKANAADARRSYPSIFQAWSGIENRPDTDELHRLAQHDLAFAHPYALLRVAWDISEEQPYSGLATALSPSQLDTARQRKQQLLSLNPNLLLLVEIRCRDARYVSRQNEADVENWWEVGYFPPDSPYWLKDSNGKPVVGWGEDTNGNGEIDENDKVLSYLIDFTNPEMQNLMVNQAVALDKSGLFDGIMLDWWNEDYATSSVGVDDWSATILTREAELEARLVILRKTREQVDDDFLILVNANMRQIPKSAPYVNGIFMECYKPEHNKGYSLDQVLQIEKTLLWAEQHLREPRINCLEGWRVVTEYMGDLNTRVAERNSSENQQWMRMITTLSLTHSDGYVLFGDDNAIPVPDHLHNWYDFWDADLGQPLQEQAVQYRDVPGLFIREFENGWAIYNRSGSEQTVTFDDRVVGVNGGKTQSLHKIPDFDGEIFLKIGAD
ncbi:MAG: putative glycoside hydrolase [Candidatus Poribacteria bacterium]|nr:putative glycoside hydrolase [Candidatus Poribacteria bacterium]